MARFVRQGVLICAMTLLAVSGCAEKEPTAAEAGETLKLHITELMKESHALDVKITDPGGRGIPCGESREKQTFAATGRHAAPNLSADALNGLLLGALSPVADYEIVEDPGKAPIHLANSTYGTKIILESPGDGRYRVHGETECLPIS